MDSEKIAAEIKKYLVDDGFGVLTKTRYESLLVKLMDEFGLLDGTPTHHCSNFELGASLGVPATKIKSLRHEAALRFSDVPAEQTAVRQIIRALTNASEIVGDDDRISVVFESELAKNWLKSQMSRGSFRGQFDVSVDEFRCKPSALFELLREYLEGGSETDKAAKQKLIDLIADSQKRDNMKALKSLGQKLLKAYEIYIGVASSL